MIAPVSTTQCTVTIVAPNGAAVVFDPVKADGALLSVETHKDMREAVGSFTLRFVPTRDAQGRTWDQVIPMRSLVTIAMDRPGTPVPEGVSPVVMVGLTDDHGHTTDWRRAQPQQSVAIHGREISSVLLDAHMWYHPRLAGDPRSGSLTTRSHALGEQHLALSWNPKLAVGGEDPETILKRILDYYLFIGGTVVEPKDTPGLQQPLMNLDLPERSLADLLHTNDGQWNTFEPVTVPIVHHAADVGSLYNYLHLFIDRGFQEFFTRIEDGVCKIHFRGKPFQHKYITSGTRFKTPEQEPTLHTILLDPRDILAEDMRRQSAQVYNVFVASPQGITQYYDDPNFLYKVLPSIVTQAEHPSYVGRYGLRPLIVQSPYLTPLVPQATTQPAASTSPLTPPPAGAATYADQAARIAWANGLPETLVSWFVANIHQESQFNPNAKSPAGAEGIAQFMPETAAAMGLTDPYDPLASLHASARYWQELRGYAWIRDDPRLIVAAYNAGPGAVQAAGGIPPGEPARHVRYVEKYQPLYANAGTPTTAPPSTPPVQQDLQALIATAERWGAVLRAWYDMGGELFAGMLTVRGHPQYNVGHRLLTHDDQGAWEAYIEGVNHQYDVRTGLYQTQLRVSRGWYLAPAIAEALFREGQTGMETLSGGPPMIEPAPGRGEVTIGEGTYGQ